MTTAPEAVIDRQELDLMSETPTEHVEAVAAVAPAHPEPQFENAELRQFESDDIEAGRAITKMLSLLFIYTVIAMSIVAYWTWSSVVAGQ